MFEVEKDSRKGLQNKEMVLLASSEIKTNREKFEENKEEKETPHPLEAKPKPNFKLKIVEKNLKITSAKLNLRKINTIFKKTSRGKSKLTLSQTRHSHQGEYYSLSSSLQ